MDCQELKSFDDSMQVITSSSTKPIRSALLSMTSSIEKSCPLRAWRQSDRERLEQAIQKTLKQWETGLGLSQTKSLSYHSKEPKVWCRTMPDALHEYCDQIGTWHGLSEKALRPDIWWTLLQSPLGQEDKLNRHEFTEPQGYEQTLLLRAIFDDPSYFPVNTGEGSLADDVAHAAAEDWWARLGNLFGMKREREDEPEGSRGQVEVMVASGIPSRFSQPWSGALLITLPWCGRTMALVLSWERVKKFLDSQPQSLERSSNQASQTAPGRFKPALTPLFQALGQVIMPLQVELAPFETDFGTIQSLRVGDILRTGLDLDLPLIIKSVDNSVSGHSESLCRGYLGKRGSQRAVQLFHQT